MGLFKSVPIIGSTIDKTVDSIFANSANAKAKRAATIQNDRNVYNMQHQYQWTMDDLKAAGLNPILAAQNGANSVNSAAEANTMKAQGGNLAEHIQAQSAKQLNDSQTTLNNVNAAGKAKENDWINEKTGQEIKESASRTLKNQQETAESTSRIALNSAKKAESIANAKQKRAGVFGYGGTDLYDGFHKVGKKIDSWLGWN